VPYGKLEIVMTLHGMCPQGHGTISGSDSDINRDISNPPKQITNKKGKIVLAKGAYLVGLGKNLSLPSQYTL
jgi:hypothetical protein